MVAAGIKHGDPAILTAFVSWVIENYPAEHYALDLWNHGSGWRATAEPEVLTNTSAGMQPVVMIISIHPS